MLIVNQIFSFLLLINPVIQIQVNEVPLTVEIADNNEAKTRGLMDRTELSETQGMLFVYSQSQMLAFWMKNTQVPLSIAFFDDKYNLINIEDMAPCVGPDYPIYTSHKPARYALEVPRGWFKRHVTDSQIQISLPW